MALLTPAEAAAALGISTSQLRVLTSSGELPFINVGAAARRTARYEPADIEAFKLTRRKVECPSTGAPARKPTRTISDSRVVDFQATLAKLRSEKRKPRSA